MQNHSEKRRDMCRSILPSSARVRARDELAAWKRHHRRVVRQSIHDAMGYEWDDWEGTNRNINVGSLHVNGGEFELDSSLATSALTVAGAGGVLVSSGTFDVPSILFTSTITGLQP